MAIPVHLQQFKAAGVYRVVFDKSTMINNEPETLRLVVGYSEVGPFNCPVYIRDPQEFVQYFGNISKKLEKRGIFFHRMCLQMLTVSPIICLNLKKFSGETLGASTINTEFNPNYDPIDDVEINVEDIFDKTRFWEISAEQLNDLSSVNGISMNNYINLSTTDTYANSVSYFIRKPSGKKISTYNVTVSDWYSDKAEEMPEYLHGFEHNLMSDFFAEIYVFKGKFRSSQVLASDSLKKYFIATDTKEEDGKNYVLKLRSDLRNAYGDLIDTLDALYSDPASNAIGHWMGSLIPYFKDKRGNYMALDILFNLDNADHKMMMSFNTDLLEEDGASIIDLSGRNMIPVSDALTSGDIINGVNKNTTFKNPLSLETIFQGVAKTNLLGNLQSPVIADKIEFTTSIKNFKEFDYTSNLTSWNSHITGSLYVADVKVDDDINSNSVDLNTEYRPTILTRTVNNDSDQTEEPTYIYSYINPWTEETVTVSADDVVASRFADNDTVNIYVNEWGNFVYESPSETALYSVVLKQINKPSDKVTIHCELNQLDYVLKNCGVVDYSINTPEAAKKTNDWHILWVSKDGNNTTYTYNENWSYNYTQGNIGGTFWYYGDKAESSSDNIIYRKDENEKPTDIIESEPYSEKNETNYYGPSKIITSIRRLENKQKGTTEADVKYTDIDTNFVCNFKNVNITSTSVNTVDSNNKESLYGSSISFIKNDGWNYEPKFEVDGGIYSALISTKRYDTTLQLILKPGDCLLADDGTNDLNGDKIKNDEDNYYDCVYVTNEGVKYDENGEFVCNYILLTGCPLTDAMWYFAAGEDGDQEGWDSIITNTSDKEYYLVRFNSALNQEIGEMTPHYLEGYTYKNARPNGTDMWSKLQWQKMILSALTDYKGLRKGLLNKSNIDYRYVVDTFESFPQSELKSELSLLSKEKESAFCIGNLPSIRTFVKCPYTSFTDSNNVFNSKYIVEGRNRKKPSYELFSLPSEINGASFIGFYTPLKFSDGYVDTIIPSAGLVSNLFIQKYMSRQPYYIVAGPNYGHIVANGLVGPDYKFSREELYDLEPFGFNCMIYRPSFGTFINANQTAKQTPLSALSRINVRELVIYLQDEIEKVLQSYQWEFNNQTTRNAILDKANQICALIKANGGIQTYLNIMDESNNTPEIIDNEMAVLSTHIEPGFGCGKMVHELTLYRTGQMKSYVSEGN